MEAHHPFCLESKLSVTDRPQADDRWPDGGGGGYEVRDGETEKWQFHTEIILCLISAWVPSSYSHLACGEAIGGFAVP